MRVVLISHCNFQINSGMQVYSLAEQLQVLGHDVVVLVPDNPDSSERHNDPVFSVRLYTEALEEDLPFRSGGTADLIHTWTPRKHVRAITLALAAKEGCPYILHMEDNEEQIIADELQNMSFEELQRLPTAYQSIATSRYRSHPSRYREFAEGAVGYTSLIDRLLEYKPDHVTGAVFWPGFDPEYENIPDDRVDVRKKLGIDPDETIVFYSGNVHPSVLADVRNLYLSVATLRARGRKTRLVRTGSDSSDMNLPRASFADRTFINLGFVNRFEMPGLLGASDLLVQPGRADRFNDYRFPSKLPEYLVSGKPVILPNSNIGYELEDGKQALKLHDGSLQELLGQMDRVLASPELATTLGREARSFALEKLRWSSAARIVDNYYRSLNLKAHLEKTVQRKAETPAAAEQHPVKIITFYAPQASSLQDVDSLPEGTVLNWAKVKNSTPILHEQKLPRIPSEFGHYAYDDVEVMHEQAKLAAEYGVGGFCFYGQWRDGSREYNRALQAWIERGPDFPFCICWVNPGVADPAALANESRHVVSYSAGFEERFVADMLPALKDARYIRVAGAPLIAVFHAEQLPDPLENAAALRQAAAKHGISCIHLVAVQTQATLDPRPIGFDAAIEFGAREPLLLDPARMSFAPESFEGLVEDYVGIAMHSINAAPTDYVRYRGCFPMYDNTPLHRTKSRVVVNDSPKAYANWLRFLVNEAMVRRDQVEPLIFVNAWNDWSGGAYLEPDTRLGRSLLEATRAALLYGVVDYAHGRPSPEREREFNRFVSRKPVPAKSN